MCKFNKSDSIISKRTYRYLKRTIKKNHEEILNDKKNIKLLNESLKYMTDYAIKSYSYNNYLINMINNLIKTNDENKKINNVNSNEVTTEVSPNTEQNYKTTIRNDLYNEDICSYV